MAILSASFSLIKALAGTIASHLKGFALGLEKFSGRKGNKFYQAINITHQPFL
jgi:hypothetical protein